MNTPRDLLLARHQAVTPRLDALRSKAIADAFTTHAPHPRAETAFLTIWHQLFWTARRTWLTLATLWIIILAVNFATPRHHTASAPATSSLIFSESVQEQLRLRAELLELPSRAPTPPHAPPPPPSPPPHRSEIPRHLPIA